MDNNEPWHVQFAAKSLEDLVEIIQYILKNNGMENAKELSSLIQTEAKRRLTTLPHRGHLVAELSLTGLECREIHIKSHRIIYKAIEANRTVLILLIVHARRSIQDMLSNRLLYYSITQ